MPKKVKSRRIMMCWVIAIFYKKIPILPRKPHTA